MVYNKCIVLDLSCMYPGGIVLNLLINQQ